MWRITLWSVGKIKPSWAEESIHFYGSRLRPPFSFHREVLSPGAGEGKARIRQEGQRILDKWPQKGEVWVLDGQGQPWSTSQWEHQLLKRMRSSQPVTILLGGAFGVDEQVIRESKETVSLGPATLSRGLAGVVAAEQIYRTWAHYAGHPYNK